MKIYFCMSLKTFFFQPAAPPIDKNPCLPSPCGPNAQCRESPNHQPICSCLSDMIGSPPNCRKECYSNSDCNQDKSCRNNKCVDPCISNPCAKEFSRCNVVNHNPICSCQNGYTGGIFSFLFYYIYFHYSIANKHFFLIQMHFIDATLKVS